ncbi:isoprenoid synthase domain-containing protein [Melanogaster broomeanus]|nr:isoprenoid synthase domain-containing protein [Melanogaster broomeanus]
MPISAYQLPDLLALLPKKPGGNINPHFEEANTRYEAWMKKMFGWRWIFALVYDSEVPLLGCLAWPLASCHELKAILDYMTSSIMLEVLTDNCSSAKAVEISRLWMETLQGGDGGKYSRHAFINAMRRELVPTMKAAIDPFHWPQFITSNEKFSKNTVQEALDREAHVDKPRNIQSYMVMRRETIGTRPCFVLMRSTRRLYIPDHVLAHPIVEEMENVALDMVFIANDIYSFKKEIGDNGALNNIMTVIQKDPTTNHLDLQGRFDYTAKLFREARDRFHACRSNLPSFGDLDLDRQVSAYADGLVDWVAGSIQWSIVNRRYNVFRNDAGQEEKHLEVEPEPPPSLITTPNRLRYRCRVVTGYFIWTPSKTVFLHLRL